MGEERGPRQAGRINRRTLIKVALVGGAAAIGGLTGYALIRNLTAPPPETARNTFLYVEPFGVREPTWWMEKGLVGREARLADFQPGQGANVQWRVAVDEEGEVAPGTGLPALLLRMEEVLEFSEGFPREEFVIEGLYAVFDCCTHACCRPGWQLIPRSQYRTDLGYENVVCPCHDSQYDPRRLQSYRHPPPPEASGAEYLGIFKEPAVGPAPRGMPLIPIHLEEGKIVGRMENLDWYRYLDFRPLAP